MERIDLNRVVVLLVVGALAGAACSNPDEPGSSSTTVAPVAATTSLATSTTTSTAPPTSQAMEQRLPLDDLDEIADHVATFLAGSPIHSDVAMELAALNNRALETQRVLGDYRGDDFSVVEVRLGDMLLLRQSLADRLTQLGLKLSQDYEMGPLLDPLNLPNLPGEGVAVEVMGATVLIDLDGVVIGHLAGYSIHYSSELPGPVKLTDPLGDEFLFVAGATALLPFNRRLPLAYGVEYVVTERSGPDLDGSDAPSRTLVGDGWDYPLGSGEMLLSSGRETVTNRIWSESAEHLFEPGASSAIDTATGSITELPDGCWVGAKYGATTYLVCRVNNADGFPLDQVYANTVGGVGLVQPPNSELAFPVGHWRWLLVSPDGSELLGQWSGDCEIPTAFRMKTNGAGQIATITAEPYDSAPASYALGWSADGRSIAMLDGSGACTEPAEQPGIHIYAGDGTSTWLYDTGTAGFARLWQPLAGAAG